MPLRRVLLVVSALALGVIAVPAVPDAAAAADSAFSTSFEDGQPQPTWTDEAETGPDGKPKVSGVTGPTPTGIGGNEMDKVIEVKANGENTGAGEVATNVADGDPYTKWLVFQPTGWLTFTVSEPVTIVKYALTSANDVPGRDPKDWTLYGSNDGANWMALDSRTNQDFTERFQTKVYEFANSTAYSHFKLDITANHGDPIVQLAEVVLSNGAPLPPPGPTMESRLDSGPTSAYNARARTGFTGVHSVRYAGHQTSERRGYSYNRILAVDLQVTADTELSYRIFPEFTEDYASTYAAIDLAFSDGTYLSELGARDQHGFPLTPRGQGAAKGLETNQWNHIESRIGTVAAGKTVKKIIIGYDKPTGPADFRGWVDDITLSATSDNAATIAATHPSDLVLTTRGTNSTGGFSRGNNFPATAVPHGFNFWTPVTNAGSRSWLYEYAKANDDANRPRLQAFSASHEPSPWMGDRQTFQVMPSSDPGGPTANRAKRSLPFSHGNEIARPYYYSVRFDNGQRAEIAPTDHAAILRFGFPAGNPTLVFDNVSNAGGLSLDQNSGVVTGYSDVRSGLSVGAGRLFVYGVVDRPVASSGKLSDGGGGNVGGYFRFAPDETAVTLRIATSLISVEQAQRNLEMELGDLSFDTVRDRAQALWDAKLKQIEVEGASRDQLTTLYSNLYRLHLYPNHGYENTGTAADPHYEYASPVSPKTGPDTPTRTGSKIVAGKLYVNNGFWDTYRTAWPAYSLLTPSLAGEMVDGFVQQYRDGGWISRWSSPGYADLMVGTSSDVAFADAYLKGVPGLDVKAAYDAALRNGGARPPSRNVGRKGMDRAPFLGYTPTSTSEGFSWSMDGYINDFGIANMSKALYDRASPDDPRRQEYLDNYRYYLNRARNYVTLYDPSVKFFQGRDANGKWRESPDTYDPRVWGYDYTETNGWNMAFSVPQDGEGLCQLYGGRAELADKLDKFFATPETAKFPGSYGGTIHEMIEARDVRMGQYGQSNQPSHHIAYMYDYANQPWKTQEKVREVLARMYLGSEIGQGYHGDEDNGEMSAWYLFSALGFYPLQVGSPSYAIGSPLFTKATVHLENGHDLVVNAPDNNAANVYVKSLKVNGKTWSSTALPHSVVAAGGRLDFEMSTTPTNWGTGADAAPPSITKPGEQPRTWRDSLDDPGATVTAPAELTDNTSTTYATVTDPVVVNLPGARSVQLYTLTVAAVASAPTAWTLQGSDDGVGWVTLDRRTGVTFGFDNYTRGFSVSEPGSYAHYRLVFDAPGTLAEVELLGTLTGAATGDHPTKHEADARRPKPNPSGPSDRNYG